MKYVIIGNSHAGIGCVEGIRSVDKDGGITIISDEKYHCYCRPLISYLLEGKTTMQKMKYRKNSFYKDNDCELLTEKRAVGINPQAKTVRLDDGSEIGYDKLLVATGSDPFLPPMKGIEKVKKRFTFMKLDDAKALEAEIGKKSRVLIIGAGLIGLKCAEGIFDRVASVKIVDLADRILPSIIDEQGSKMVKSFLEKKGFEFFLNDSVEEFKNGVALLKSGEKIEFDVLVTAVGVRPNTALVKEAGGEVRRGIVCDASGKTSLPDIYAAGDCCESYDISSGEEKVLAILPNAYLQGECAGINMAGVEKSFDKAIPMNAIGFMGLHMITAGTYTGHKYERKTATGYKALFTKGGYLRGFILIGDTVEHAGIYTSIIREKTPLRLLDFEMLKEQPQFMAFAAAKRKEMFAVKKGGKTVDKDRIF